MAIVYQHRRTDTNEIFYVGIGKKESRPYSKHNRGKFWKDFTKNHPYIVEILYENISWEEACEIEKRLIKEIGRRDLGLGPLVNMTDGGEGTLNIKYSQITIEKFKARIKEKNSFFGKKHSEETIQKLKHPKTQETIQKLKLAHKAGVKFFHGKKHSEESKKKIGTIHKNKVLSEETKEKIRASKKVTPKITCPHCNKLGDVSNMKRYHFENCKQKTK